MFRGGSYDKEFLDNYREGIGRRRYDGLLPEFDEPGFVCLKGFQSFTEDFTIGLKFACSTMFHSEQIPVLFILLLQNYERYNGFRLDRKVYTAYPYESELLL